ncbi:cupin domain-containing protein [Burkholderia sp. WSM2232]|uniref:cupin domain-containing protein n=1 Tax=Burkholderia sp. WSM2232 TaxID=944436 RepID=UPI0003F75958|nr:cupin domain-containing protein [Burkholderia sp. WSM2232]
MTTDHPSLEEIVERFGMERHHLAGWYAPHYSDSEVSGPPRLSSMYYLLAGDEPVQLHKLNGIEVWHYYLGAPVEMLVTNGSRMHQVSLLGADLAAGQRPQLAVPAHVWHASRSLGEWTLLGCTMSPGYSPHSPFVLNVIG